MSKSSDQTPNEYKSWLEEYQHSVLKSPERKKRFETPSGIPLEPLYARGGAGKEPQDDLQARIGFPGSFPYVRGAYPSMYRSRVWTKRLLTGFGSPEQANERIKIMLAAGETGINFPNPSISMRGMDTDQAAESLDIGYIGLFGTNLDTLVDLDLVMKDIPIDKLSVNYSDHGPFISQAMHFALAEKRGIGWTQVKGTTNQADCYSHMASCWDFVLFPLEAHLQLTLDHFKWCIKNTPQWWPLSIIGQHHSQGGASAIQELAFTLASGFDYVQRLVDDGVPVDTVVSRISAFFDAPIYVFETAAKLRAARRIWARVLKERFRAKESSCQLRIHVQTSGVELTRTQPLGNVVRVTLQALGAILGGANSLHTDSYDEPLCVPSEQAQILALMTQHILSEESGVADVIDPLGGSYFFEWLTDEMERRAMEYIERIWDMGGMLHAIESGFVQSEMAKTAYSYQRAVEDKERVVVGVNEYVVEEEPPQINYPTPNQDLVRRQIERTKRIRLERNQVKANSKLEELKKRASGKEQGSVFDAVIGCVKSDCTRGEIVRTLREVYGEGKPVIVLG